MKLAYFIALVLLALLSGCADYAAPNFLNGRYYLAGDDDCKYMRPLSDTRIMCQDSSRKDKGYRDAMTDQQLLMYNQQQQVNMQNAVILSNALKPAPTLKANCTSNVIGNQVYTNCY